MAQQLRRINPVSCAKVLAVLYAALGLLIGGFFSIFFFLAALIGGSAGIPNEMRSGPISFIFGVGSIIFFPLFYSAIGALSGLIMAALYNVAARYVGGIEIEIG